MREYRSGTVMNKKKEEMTMKTMCDTAIRQETICITEHAAQRLKERAGLNTSARTRMATKVFLNGVPREHTKGKLRRWLDCKYEEYGKYGAEGNNMRVHGDFLWIFCDTRLVTVYRIPTNIVKDPKQYFVGRTRQDSRPATGSNVRGCL